MRARLDMLDALAPFMLITRLVAVVDRGCIDLVVVELERNIQVFLEQIFSVVIQSNRQLQRGVEQTADETVLQLVLLGKCKHVFKILQFRLFGHVLLVFSRKLFGKVLLEVGLAEILVLFKDFESRLFLFGERKHTYGFRFG